jgi:hypothetical protein
MDKNGQNKNKFGCRQVRLQNKSLYSTFVAKFSLNCMPIPNIHPFVHPLVRFLSKSENKPVLFKGS